MLKGYLDEKKIAYTEKQIDTDPAAQEEMLSLSDGFMGTPFTVVKKDDGSQLTIQGFNKEKIDKALGLS